MITANAMLNFLMCFPKCKLTKPDGGVQYLIDAKGNYVGEVNWNNMAMSVYDDYPYVQQVCDQIESATGEKVKDMTPHRYKDKLEK